jgi:hypothetical protein
VNHFRATNSVPKPGYRPVPPGVRELPWDLHPMAAATGALPREVDWLKFYLKYFQGDTGSCVGHGTVNGVNTTLGVAGLTPPEPLCPLSVYTNARCMERIVHKYRMPLGDNGTDPNLAAIGISTWGIATCREWMRVDGPGEEYTRALEAMVNHEPKLGQFQSADRFRVIGQHIIISTDQQRLDDVATALAAGFGVGISVYASDDRFQGYSSGVLPDPPPGAKCDHWVALGGYETIGTTRVLRGMNSWKGWGEGGAFSCGPRTILAADCIAVYSVRQMP